MNKQKHLNLESRLLIETLLNERNSFKSIARHLGKDCTTISKEVKAHICFDKTGAYGRAFKDCRLAFLHQCSIQKICYHCTASNARLCWTCGKCNFSCISYEKYLCLSFQNRPMSAMAVSSAANVPWKNAFTKLLMLKENTNRSEVNPVQGLLFLKQNSGRLMTWYHLFSKKDNPFITSLFTMPMNS